MASRTPACVWGINPGLVVALDERFGEPVDTYVNGSQVWLRDDGPGGVVLEWRLHPVAGYTRPAGATTEELFADTALALAQDEPTVVPLDQLWDALECFPAYGDDVEPSPLAAAATESLGIAPEASGLVDHDVIGDAWERANGDISMYDALMEQLRSSPKG